MNQIDADRFDELAEAYSTQADYCRHEAEGPLDPWMLLATAWTKLAEETKARSGIAAELTIIVAAKCARNTRMRTTDSPAHSASSFQFFNQRPETDRIVRQHQRVGKRFQVLWQFAVGAGVHSGDDRGDCVHKIALAEIIERLSLAPLDILVSGHIGYSRVISHCRAIPPQQARSSLPI